LYMLNKRVIKICLGSSCFSRGNQDLIAEVQKFIRTHSLEDKVAFSGDHCFTECSQGPNIMINGHKYNGISKESIPGILEQQLRDLL
jgi:NADH:ubiquinone oxidoreductase subunit E